VIGDRVLEFDDLQRLSGQSQPAAVERWAEQNGVPFKRSRRGIWTTLDALNAALGVVPAAANDESQGLSPDLV
jgi:hypothetical protein